MACEIKIQLPTYLQSIRNNKYVYIDKEIVDVLKQLWKHNIVTLGICNGHSSKDSPSIIIDSSYKEKDILRIRNLIKLKDKRYWKILQWKLVEV